MKKLILILSLLLASLVLSSCGSSNELLNITWQWTSLTETQPAAQSVVPNPENYSVIFNEDGTFNATVDCNQVSGSYELEGNKLTVMPGPSTLAECGPDSLYDLFLGFFSQITAYEMDGESLILIVGEDTARMFFQNASLTR